MAKKGENWGGPRPKVRLDDQRGSPTTGVATNPAYIPSDEDRKLVTEHAAIMGRKMMARRLGISENTLDRHYGKEITEACFRFAAVIGGKVAARAMKGDPGAQYFVLRRFGWTDREELGGQDETPQDQALTVPPEVLEALSDEDFAAYERLCDIIARSTPGLTYDRPPVEVDREEESREA